MKLQTVLLATATIFCGGIAEADTVELYGSGQVAGKVLRVEKAGKRPFVLMQLDDDLQIAIPQTRVKRVTTSDELAAYRVRAGKAGNNAEFHYQLAIWCQGNSLSRQSRYHMQRTVTLDPDHNRARAALGYVEEDGKWILYSQQQRDRGLVYVGGRWKVPETVALDRMREDADVRAKKWIKEVTKLRALALRGSKKSPEALESLKAINDPLAADAIAKELNDSRGNTKQSRQMRLMWVTLLGRFRNVSAVRALTRAGVEEPDHLIRESALDELQKYGAPSAVATYVAMLNPDKNSHKRVQQALRALSFFPDRELAMTYIDALITKHKREVGPPPGQIAAGNGNNGIGGLAMGGKKKVVTEQFRNTGALTLLKMVEPGVDYGFDKQAWREHFAAQLTAYQGSLRRDP